MSLSYIGDRRAVKPLLGMLDDPESGTRMTVILSLGRLGDKSAADLLIRILHAGRSDERWAAARALGWIGDRRAVPGLIRALKSRDNDLRWQAAESLGEMRDPRAVRPLISLISSHRHAGRDIVCGCEEASSSMAAWALSMIGGSEAEAFLASSIKEGKTLVVSGAYAYFIEKGIPGSEAELIKSLNEDGLASTARHFLHSGNPKLAQAAKQWAERHPDEKKLIYKDVPQDQPRWGQRTLKRLPNYNCSGI